MWIFFFDSKKYNPKKFLITGQALDHLIATYFYATDTRKKDLKILTQEDRAKLKTAQKIESPMWKGR